MRLSKEATVGAFTILGTLAFIVTVMFMKDIALFEAQGMHVKGVFSSVTGLKTGYTVKYSGVEVGKISDIQVTQNGVYVDMNIQSGLTIPKDSHFSIQGDGLLGEKFIQIEPGTSTEYLVDGSTVKGEGNTGVDKAIGSAGEVMEEANRMMKAVNAIIGDKKTQESMKGALQSTDNIAKNIEVMTAQMNSLLAQNSSNINELTSNMVRITRNMEQVTQQLDKSLKLIDGDSKTSENIRVIAENMKDASVSMNKMAKSLEEVVADPESLADLKETIHNTAHLSTVLNSVASGGHSLGITPEVNMLYNTSRKEYDPNLTFRFMNSHSVAEVGVSHIGNQSAMELNYGKKMGKISLRGGVFDGDLGFGIDYGFNEPFSLSLAAMDPNGLRYRLRSQIRLFGNAYLAGQFIRPYGGKHGGDYIGLSYRY